MSNYIPHHFQALLPSSPVESLDIQKDKTYIIESLLKKSTWQGWQWMLSYYSPEEITEVISISRALTPKDVMLWTHFYNLNPKDIACLQKKFPPTHSNSWAY